MNMHTLTREPADKQSAKHIAGNRQVDASIYFLLRFTE